MAFRICLLLAIIFGCNAYAEVHCDEYLQGLTPDNSEFTHEQLANPIVNMPEIIGEQNLPLFEEGKISCAVLIHPDEVDRRTHVRIEQGEIDGIGYKIAYGTGDAWVQRSQYSWDPQQLQTEKSWHIFCPTRPGKVNVKCNLRSEDFQIFSYKRKPFEFKFFFGGNPPIGGDSSITIGDNNEIHAANRFKFSKEQQQEILHQLSIWDFARVKHTYGDSQIPTGLMIKDVDLYGISVAIFVLGTIQDNIK